MTLHVFNPDHDIALSANLSNFTAPHAARLLRHDLGWLPALWAADGDCVLVEDAAGAAASYRHFCRRQWGRVLRRAASDVDWREKSVTFVEAGQLASLPVSRVEPWGWDMALRAFLLRHGVEAALLPGDDALGDVRLLSNRSLSVRLLPLLRMGATTGESSVCTDVAQAEALLQRHKSIVVKAPWSSSGRGLRFADQQRTPLSQHLRWMDNVLRRQGSLTVEPYYPKVCDFGMEFLAHDDGRVSYCGLSLFRTRNGAYTGNVIATEARKQQFLSHYADPSLLDAVRNAVCTRLPELLGGRYGGPLGIDMMVVRGTGGNGFLLHPCVEVNLRRTMGHAVLSLMPSDDDHVFSFSVVKDHGFRVSLRTSSLGW